MDIAHILFKIYVKECTDEDISIFENEYLLSSFIDCGLKYLGDDEIMDNIVSRVLQVVNDNDDDFYSDLLTVLVRNELGLYYYKEKNDNLVNFYKQFSVESLKRIINHNKDFLKKLLANFYIASFYSKETNVGINNLREDGKFKLLKNWFNVYTMQTINMRLKMIVINLYNYYNSLDIPLEEIIPKIWSFFTRDEDPLHELETMGCTTTNKQLYKDYILRLIYLDVYEDCYNHPIIKQNNRTEFAKPFELDYFIRENIVSIPNDEELKSSILVHFLELISNIDKRAQNREYSIKTNKEETIKKFLPTYKLDNLAFEKKI